jgi:hypothetical protein
MLCRALLTARTMKMEEVRSSETSVNVHQILSQTTLFFIATAVRTSNQIFPAILFEHIILAASHPPRLDWFMSAHVHAAGDTLVPSWAFPMSRVLCPMYNHLVTFPAFLTRIRL